MKLYIFSTFIKVGLDRIIHVETKDINGVREALIMVLLGVKSLMMFESLSTMTSESYLNTSVSLT